MVGLAQETERTSDAAQCINDGLSVLDVLSGYRRSRRVLTVEIDICKHSGDCRVKMMKTGDSGVIRHGGWDSG